LLIGAELDISDAPAEPAVAVQVEKKKPVVLACPNCQGALKASSEAARTIACEFCQADVYIPDDLWRSLHPVKKVRPWTIVHQGFLFTADQIAKEDRQAAREAQKIELRARGEMERREAVRKEAEQRARRQERTKHAAKIATVILVLAAIAGVSIYLAAT
jgi:hypothetical protein